MSGEARSPATMVAAAAAAASGGWRTHFQNWWLGSSLQRTWLRLAIQVSDTLYRRLMQKLDRLSLPQQAGSGAADCCTCPV